MKYYVVEIGWTGYIVQQFDAVTLLAIASRAIRLEGYPPKVAADQDPFAVRVELQEVESVDEIGANNAVPTPPPPSF